MNYSMNTNLIRTGMLCLVVLIGGLLCGCEKLKISDDLAGFDPEGDLAQIALVLTGPGQASGQRLPDIGEGKIYTLDEAIEHPELIDFVTLWGSSSGMNLVSPIDISRLTSFGTGRTMNETFMVKNATNFVKLNPTEENLKLYDNISRAADVKTAYDRAVSIV